MDHTSHTVEELRFAVVQLMTTLNDMAIACDTWAGEGVKRKGFQLSSSLRPQMGGRALSSSI